VQSGRPVLRVGPRGGYAVVVVVVVLAVPLIAFMIGLASNFGAGAHSDYYATVAQISGTVFAILVGVLAFLQPHFDLSSTNTHRYLEALGAGLFLQVLLAAGSAL
jgi:hypothetical protein